MGTKHDGSTRRPLTGKRAMNLPNALSCIRILLVPILVVVLLTSPKLEDKELIGLGLFLLAALTDFLDGFIARRWGLVTRLGKLLDPAADKILTSAAFISLVGMGHAEAWIVVTIVAREFAVSTLRSFAAAEGLVIPASPFGKAKTVVQMVAISLLIILDYLTPPYDQLAHLALYLALALSIASGVEYGVRYVNVLRGRETAASDD